MCYFSSYTVCLIFSRKDDNKDIDSEKEAAMEAEIKAARERAIVPLEARMKQFKDMLLERGVREISVCVCVRRGEREGEVQAEVSILSEFKTRGPLCKENSLILALINGCIWYKTPYFKECYNYSKILISK